jgi:hypothetical protein
MPRKRGGMVGSRGEAPLGRKRSSSAKRSERLWDSHSFIFGAYRRLFPTGIKGWDLNFGCYKVINENDQSLKVGIQLVALVYRHYVCTLYPDSSDVRGFMRFVTSKIWCYTRLYLYCLNSCVFWRCLGSCNYNSGTPWFDLKYFIWTPKYIFFLFLYRVSHYVPFLHLHRRLSLIFA